jgi:hypothetical protein
MHRVGWKFLYTPLFCRPINEAARRAVLIQTPSRGFIFTGVARVTVHPSINMKNTGYTLGGTVTKCPRRMDRQTDAIRILLAVRLQNAREEWTDRRTPFEWLFDKLSFTAELIIWNLIELTWFIGVIIGYYILCQILTFRFSYTKLHILVQSDFIYASIRWILVSYFCLVANCGRE